MFAFITSKAPAIALACLLSAALAAGQAASAETDAFHERIDRSTVEWLQMHPQSLTGLGLNVHDADGRANSRLDDTSLAALEAEKAFFFRAREALSSVDPSSLGRQEALTHAIALRQYDGALERAAYPWAVDLAGRITFAIDHMHGPQTSLPRFMRARHPLRNVDEARAYVARLQAFGDAFDGSLARMAMQREAGVIPPAFVLENVLEDARIFTAPAPGENPLVRHFADALGRIEGADEATRDRLRQAAAAAMEEVVYPAFRRLIAACQELLGEATNDGVWALPDGLAWYDTMLRVETTTDLSAEEIHRMGLAEVARISSEMEQILERHGLEEGSPGQRIRALATDPRHLFANDAAGRRELIACLEAVLEDMQERQRAYFGVLPRAPVVVRRVPEFAEASQTIAYYGAGSIDGARPGTYFINLRNTNDMPKWALPSLSYHEAIPGHHLQIMLGREIEDLPLYRRTIGVTAFVEGWALYAEQLAWEMGVYDDYPLGNLGRLQYEMWRAVRMVVDTGIHVKRWSKEEAIRYFIAMTGMSDKDAQTEIERYFVTPGSAPAYKLGMLKILELRARAEESLGEAFDIAAFHDAVLQNGPLPLAVLEETVGQWLTEQQAAGERTGR